MKSKNKTIIRFSTFKQGHEFEGCHSLYECLEGVSLKDRTEQILKKEYKDDGIPWDEFGESAWKELNDQIVFDNDETIECFMFLTDPIRSTLKQLKAEGKTKMENQMENKMTQKTKTKLMTILNDDNIISGLEYFKDRWNQEKQFEDWNDYVIEIEKLFGQKIIKATKRPFGAVLKVNGETYQIFLKNKGSNQICLAARKKD